MTNLLQSNGHLRDNFSNNQLNRPAKYLQTKIINFHHLTRRRKKEIPLNGFREIAKTGEILQNLRKFPSDKIDEFNYIRLLNICLGYSK